MLPSKDSMSKNIQKNLDLGLRTCNTPVLTKLSAHALGTLKNSRMSHAAPPGLP